jgi:hypothetical protein
MDKTLRFWVDVAYEHIKSDHIDLPNGSWSLKFCINTKNAAMPCGTSMRMAKWPGKEVPDF